MTKKRLITLLIATGIILTIVILFYIVCNAKYIAIKKEYIKVAQEIYNQNAIEDIKNKTQVILTKQDMNYIFETPPLDNTCTGYTIITTKENKKVKIKAYIRCGKKYKSFKFNDNFME